MIGVTSVCSHFDSVISVIQPFPIHSFDQCAGLVVFIYGDAFIHVVAGMLANINRIACGIVKFIPKQRSVCQKFKVHGTGFINGNDISGAATFSGTFADFAVTIAAAKSNNLKIPPIPGRKVRKIHRGFRNVGSYAQLADGGVAHVNVIPCGIRHCIPFGHVSVPT